MNRILLALGVACTCLQASAQTPTLIDISSGSTSSQPASFTVFNGKLYFYASDVAHGRELWVRDGTNAPTMVADINAGTASSYNAAIEQKAMTSLNGKLYFVASDGTKGEELYSYSGSGAPALAKEIEPGSQSSFIQQMVTLNGILYFRAQTSANGSELWKYDPGASTATRLTDINNGAGNADPLYLTIYNNKLYFQANNGSKKGLWRFDPATGVADSVVMGTGGFGSANTPNNLTVANGKLFFTATTMQRGRELYSYNGSGNATRLTNMNGGSDGFNTDMLYYNNMLYTGCNTGSNNYQLYKYDPATTDSVGTLVYAINATGNANPSSFFNYGTKLYFTADNGTAGAEMWKFDGSNTPSLVADIANGAAASDPTGYTLYNYTMYFSANDGSSGKELYSLLDPTVQGINDLTFSGEIKAYPNPTANNVNLDITTAKLETFNIIITDVQGREVYTTGMTRYTAGTNTISVPMQQLSSGTYFYTAIDQEGKTCTSGKLIKQ